jgi:hypothetical protein
MKRRQFNSKILATLSVPFLSTGLLAQATPKKTESEDDSSKKDSPKKGSKGSAKKTVKDEKRGGHGGVKKAAHPDPDPP